MLIKNKTYPDQVTHSETEDSITGFLNVETTGIYRCILKLIVKKTQWFIRKTKSTNKTDIYKKLIKKESVLHVGKCIHNSPSL